MDMSESQYSDRQGQALSKKNILRFGSAAMLSLFVFMLVWGAIWQLPRDNPFSTPSFVAWLLEPQPHRAFREMPFVPREQRFVPRALCEVADKCGGLAENSAGRLTFVDENNKPQTAVRIHRVASSGNLYAISSSGGLFALAEGPQPRWRQILLPEDKRAERSNRVDLPGSGGATCAAFSSDSTKIATGYEDGTVRVWSAVDGRLISSDVPLGSSPVRSIAFSPNDNEMAVATGSGTWGVVSLDLSKNSARFSGRSEPFRSIQYAPDGSKLITTSSFGSLELWSTRDGRRLKTVGNSRLIDAVSISPDGTRIAVVSDGLVSIMDAESGRPVQFLKGHPEVNFSAFSPDSARVVTSSRDGHVKVWEVSSGRPIFDLTSVNRGLVAAMFTPDDTQVMAISPEAVTFWNSDLGTLDHVQPLLGGPESVTIISPDTLRIAQLPRGAQTVFIQAVWSRPNLKDLTSDGDGTVWVVGSNGYVAAGKQDGPFINSQLGDRNSDLIAVAPLASGDGVTTLGSDNSLGHWKMEAVAKQESNGKLGDGGAPTKQIGNFEQIQSQRAVAREIKAIAIFPPKKDAGKLRALSFATDTEGWVAGDKGIVLHTEDRGLNWTKMFERKGLTLSDVVLEAPSRIGWALGQYDSGRITIIAANKAREISTPNGWHELPHYIAPWYFFFGIPAFLLAVICVVMAWRPDPIIPPKSIEEVANSDAPLRWTDPESAALKPPARGLSRFLRNVNTQPPLTLAITGRWGSGKSSLMNLLMADLQSHGGRAVWFNAWHHREEEHLLAALFETIRREAAPGWWSWPGLTFRARLLWRRTKRTLLNLLYAALFLAVVVFTVRESLPSFHAAELDGLLKKLVEFAGKEAGRTWSSIAATALAGSGGLALFSLWLRGKLVALPANPAKLVSALSRRASLTDFSDKLAFRQKFGEQFQDVCYALLTRRSAGLVILIDDLDRCQPDDVLKVLEAVNYLVWAGPCVIVLGMDRRQIEYCVGLGFEKLVEGLPEDELIYAADETPDKAGKQRAFARHYLEKLINIEVPVPALDETATSAMLSGATKVDEVEPPRWLNRLKRAATNTYQIARVGLVAFVIGITVTWSLERLREEPSVASTLADVAKPTGKEATDSGLGPEAPQREARVTGPQAFKLARVDLLASPPMQELPSSRRWLWWSPTILLIGLALLFGIAAAVQRRREIVEDSPAFAEALKAINYLLAAVSITPRGIKRYQNRMRYLAARMRPAGYQPDVVDIALHWIGKKLGRPLVPNAWFEVDAQDRLSMPEPALIALGAIEVIAPSAFGNPAEVYSILENGTSRDWFTDALSAAWSKVRTAYAKEDLAMPTFVEFKRYAEFVQSRASAKPSQSADVVSLHPTSGPRSA